MEGGGVINSFHSVTGEKYVHLINKIKKKSSESFFFFFKVLLLQVSFVLLH